MNELAEKLAHSGSKFWYRSCDVRYRDQVYSSVNDFYADVGRLDVAWVNSGIGVNTAFAKWNWDDIEVALNTNLKGAIYTVRACLEIMVTKKAGTVVGIGSAAAMRGLPTRSIYCLTKIGFAYFLESLAAELPEIQFTMIHPGFVDTPINANNPNRFWLLPPATAAQMMIRAVAKRKRLYIYPSRMNLLYRAVRLLPIPIYLDMAHKMLHKIRRTRD